MGVPEKSWLELKLLVGMAWAELGNLKSREGEFYKRLEISWEQFRPTDTSQPLFFGGKSKLRESLRLLQRKVS